MIIVIMMIITIIRSFLWLSGRELPAVDVVCAKWDRAESSSHDHSATCCWPQYMCIYLSLCVCMCVCVFSSVTSALQSELGVIRKGDKS